MHAMREGRAWAASCAPIVACVAAGTFTGILAAVFLGTFPALSFLVRGAVSGTLNIAAGFAVERVQFLELDSVQSVILAQCLAVAAAVLLSAFVMGLGRGMGLLGQLIAGLAAGLLSTLTLISTFSGLPQEKALDLSLIPVGVALMGVTIVLASALDSVNTPQ